MIKHLFLSLLIALPLISGAQEYAYEYHLGMGNSGAIVGYAPIVLAVPLPVPYMGQVAYSAGFTQYVKPVGFPFWISGGASFSRREHTDLKANYLQIPFGFEKVMGKKFQFLLGLGPFASVMLSHTYPTQEIPRFSETRNIVQAGMWSKIGFYFHLGEGYKLGLYSMQMMDLVYMYDDYEVRHNAKGTQSNPIYGVSSQLHVSLRRNLN